MLTLYQRQKHSSIRRQWNKIQSRLRFGNGFLQCDKGRKVVLHRTEMPVQLRYERLKLGISLNLETLVSYRSSYKGK
jgi:hypothetical protein